MKNHRVLYNFVTHWGELVREGSEGTAIFKCTVVYHFKNKSVTEQTKAMIQRHGYEDGKISLVESGKLTSERFHLDFVPDFQTYSLTPEKLLKISGSSPKMGGPYEVVLLPLGGLGPGEFP